MYGLYHHFNSLRFNKTQSINETSAAHVVIQFASSEILKSARGRGRARARSSELLDHVADRVLDSRHDLSQPTLDALRFTSFRFLFCSHHFPDPVLFLAHQTI